MSLGNNSRFWLLGIIVIIFTSLLLFLSYYFVSPPSNFPKDEVVSISRGLSASQIADHLADKGVVRSSGVLYLTLLWFHNPSSIQAGTYEFTEPISVFAVANRITSTRIIDNLISLTLPEGYTAREFASLADGVLTDFNEEEFINLTSNQEGLLFPDTYYIPSDYTATELVNLLTTTYKEKTNNIFQNNNIGLDEYEILILASLLEREANTEESMRAIAGILLARLEVSMRLQVDASVEYVVGHKLNGTRAADLEIDSPYNTYLYKGLPPTPIGNPGLTAIKAVLYPAESDYFYYITDSDGVFHYAMTFDEHKDNIARYLR